MAKVIRETEDTPSNGRASSKHGGFGRFCFRSVFAIGVVLFFLPTIVGWLCTSPDALSWVSGQPAGTIQVGHASFTWQGPVQLNDVVINAPDGHALANVNSLTSERSLWDLLTLKKEPLKLRLDGIRITAKIADPEPPQGRLDLSDFTQTLQNFRIPRPAQPMQVTITNGKIDFQNAQREHVETWSGISATYQYETSDQQLQNVDISIPESIENGTGEISLQGQWTLADDAERSETISLEGQGEQISLLAAEPWLRKYLGEGHGLRTCTGALQASFERDRITGWELDASAKFNENMGTPEVSIDQVAFAEPELPQAELELQSKYSKPDDQLSVPKLHVSADDAAVNLEGSVQEISGQQILKVLAEVQTPGGALMDLLPAEIREQIQVEGMKFSQISISGSLLPALDGSAQPLTYSLIASWDQLLAYGLQSDNGELKISYSEGQIRAEPINVPISGGRLLQVPTLDVRTTPPTLRFQKGVLLENVALTEEVCRDWLKYVSPTLANATSAEGRLTLVMNEGQMVVGKPEEGQLSGTLAIRDGQVRPGPLAIQLLQQVGQAQQLLNRGGADLTKKAFLTMPQEDVQFELRDGRVYHQNFGANVGEVRISTVGSVGLDQTLALQMNMAFPDKWKQNDRPVLQALLSQPLSVDITGTLDDPKIDATGLAEAGKEIGIKAGAGLLERLIERRMERPRRKR